MPEEIKVIEVLVPGPQGPIGQTGPMPSLTVVTERIEAVEIDLEALKDEAANPLLINALTVTQSVFEVGQQGTVNFNFALSKDPETLSMDNGVGALDVTARTASKTGVTANTTFTLKAVGLSGTKSVTRSVSVVFWRRVYWGISSQAVLTGAQVAALANSALSATRAREFTLDGGASPGQYVYYAYPQEMDTGQPPLGYKINSFDETPVVTVVSVTNAHGMSAPYVVVRSENPLFGTNPVRVV